MGDRIPCLDLKRQYEQIRPEVETALRQVCEQTAFSGGAFVERFEEAFARYCGVEHAIGVNSGTSALHLALIALGIQPGDEVIVPANTFIASAWAVSYVNATPVFVDCTNDTWNIDCTLIERRITKKTKAIIGVHLYGQPCDLGGILKVARDHRLLVVEDCAQAHGARYRGKHVGVFGDMGCFSFYPGKNLGAYGEAGAIITHNSDCQDHLRRLRNHGSSERYHHEEVGHNMRMDGFQGAILELKLRHLDAWNERRKSIARTYHECIKNDRVRAQLQPSWSDSAYHLFVVTADDREALLCHLQANGIQPGLHYPVPCHLQKAYAQLGYKRGDCPNAEHLSDHCLSLPMYAELTDQEVSHVVDTLNRY